MHRVHYITARAIAALSVALAGIGCHASTSPALCLPPGVSPASAGLPDFGEKAAVAPTKVYLDGSESMAGYIAGEGFDIRPVGDFIDVMLHRGGSSAKPAQFFAFGSKIAPIPDGAAGARRYGTLEPYTCKGCDSRESHIGMVLDEIAAADPGQTYVVLTDLWLDRSRFGASPKEALGITLTQMLKQGRSIGVFGIKAPFRGKIFDFPTPGFYTRATERPLFALIIGPAGEVSRLHNAVATSPSLALAPERSHYSVFTARPGNRWAAARAMSARGGGVLRSAAISPERFPGVQQFSITMSTARIQRGTIDGEFDARAGIRDNGVWSGPPRYSSHVWSLRDSGPFGSAACGPARWTAVNPLRNPWVPLPDGTRARFSITPSTAASLDPGHAYYIVGTMGVGQLQSPNPTNAWMRDKSWSFNAANEPALRGRTTLFFPTLNLDQFASSLEAALQTAAPNGVDTLSVGFLVTVKR